MNTNFIDAELQLLAELEKGEQSAKEHGWISESDLLETLTLSISVDRPTYLQKEEE